MARAVAGNTPDLSLHPLHGWRFTVPSGQARNQFFSAGIGNRRATALLCFDVVAEPYLAAEPSIRLPAVSVYRICAGAVDGAPIGYLFLSPLERKLDPFFALFHRPQWEPVASIRDGTEGKNRYQLKGGISIFTVEDDAVLATVHRTSVLTEALDS